MTREQINILLTGRQFPELTLRAELIETHISWVIVCDRYVYKIKKPVCYAFLDFSTLEKRNFFCRREIILNTRLTENIYIDVQPVIETSGRLSIGEKQGTVIDYAVCMHKADRRRQMDVMLLANEVTESHIWQLAQKIAAFHKTEDIIPHKELMDVCQKFTELEAEIPWLEQQPGLKSAAAIRHAIEVSESFMEQHRTLLATRLKAGYFRDCHGDLHTRNIFLLDAPQPFDCIEFNDDFRQIDVLNEVAFLCMDLDAFGRFELSNLFLHAYNSFFPTVKTREDYLLFIYYKSYRANVRAKVNSLRARSAADEATRNTALNETYKYLSLMDKYIATFQ